MARSHLSLHNQTLSHGRTNQNFKAASALGRNNISSATIGTHNHIGLDFLDVKREIQDELRQVNKKMQSKLAKHKMVQDSSI